MDGEVNCIVVTPKGFIFHRIPFEQLRDSREMVNASPKGSQIVFAIDTERGQVNAIDILMMYSCSLNRYDDDNGEREPRSG
jgi:hypothetical protein